MEQASALIPDDQQHERPPAAVDLLRAIAIVWLIAFHIAAPATGFVGVDTQYGDLGGSLRGDPAGIVPAFWHLLLRLGYQGVPLFLMLTAFAMTYARLRAPAGAAMGTMYRRILPRTLATYWVALAITLGAIAVLALIRHADGAGFGREFADNTYRGRALYHLDAGGLVAGLALIPRGFSEDWFSAPSPSLWVVLLLLQFYAVFPLLMRALAKFGPWWFAGAALVITIVVKVPLVISHGGFGLLFYKWIDDVYLPFNLFSFALGMIFAWLYVHERDALRRQTAGAGAIALIVYAGLMVHTGGGLAQGATGIVGAFSGPMIVLGLTVIAAPLIVNLSDGAMRDPAARAFVGIGGAPLALLAASDPLQFVAGMLHQREAPAAAWIAYGVAYIPALLALTFVIARTAMAIASARPEAARSHPRVAVASGALAVAAIAGGVAAFATAAGAFSGGSDALPFLPERPAVAYLDKQICPLLGTDGGGAQIKGQDGGTTNVTGGTSYWTFGDTIKQDGDLISNNVASSTDFNAEDCVALDYKHDANGVAAELLPKEPGELTVWPAAGQLSLAEGSVYFLYNSVADANNGTGTYDFRGFGLAKFDTATLQGKRIIEFLITPDDIPDAATTLTQPVDMLERDGYVYIYFSVNWNARVGRVPAAQIEDKSAYRYWDGHDWVPEPRRSVDILRTAGGEQAFNVRYNPSLKKWTAIYSTNTLTAVAIAYADAPEGPFTDETVLFSCKGLFPPGTVLTKFLIQPKLDKLYLCYHATQHPELDKDGRQTLYLTYANLATYRLYIHKVVLAVPIVQWDAPGGQTQYTPATSQVDGSTRRGVAFYAPSVPTDGTSPIHDWFDAASGAHRYEAASPGASFADRGVAFYASTSERDGLAAIYRWERGGAGQSVYSSFDLTSRGYTRGAIAFYAKTLDTTGDLDPDIGYVYWVHTKGGSDFGCCDQTNNPTRQTQSRHSDFVLGTDQDARGYEGVVCAPVCGSGGRVVWSGEVKFSPPGRGGKLRLTPNGPLIGDR